MQNLIDQLFASEGMTRNTSTDLELYEYTNPIKKNYWLIIYDEPIVTPAIQAEWLSKCKKATADPALEKNINLLIIWNTDSSNVLANKRVHYIEEDSYFFKKHVLPYATEELESLNKQIATQGFATVFREFINAPSTFIEYKSHYLDGGWQSLLYRLAIKLPFISVNSSDNSDLASLKRNIHQRIQRTANSGVLFATDSAIDSLALQITKPNVTPEDLLTFIDEKLLEAGYETDR